MLPYPRYVRATIFVGTSLAALCAFAGAAPSSASAAACDRYAATNGHDSARGSSSAPYRTVQRLADSLAGGGVGCVQPGTYFGNVIIRKGGSPTRPLLIRSAAGARSATLRAIVQIDDTANYVTIDRLRLDGAHPPTANSTQIMIFGDHVRLSNNNIFNGGERICVSTGDPNGRLGIAWYPTIHANRIHNCGNKDLPIRTYPSGHAIYLAADRFAQVTDNIIYDTNFGGLLGGRGIQLWPDSEHSTIAHNIVDNANQWSIIVSGGAGYATGHTQDVTVRDNILTNPVESNVTSAWWGLDPQPGVVVTGNCMSGAPKADLDFVTWLGKPSYSESLNIHVADARYANRSKKDFRLLAHSPCTGKGPA